MFTMLLMALLPLGAMAQNKSSRTVQAAKQEPITQVIERGLKRAASQSLLLANSMKNHPDQLPQTYEHGELKTVRYDNWVSGFFPGVLWMLYDYTNDEQYRRLAHHFTEIVEPAKKLYNTHDIGFMLYCSFGQGYNLTAKQYYLDVIYEGTQNLLCRWNEDLGVFRSWDFGKQWQYPVIIDNMMNLEILCFMSRQYDDPYYKEVAEIHAKNTLKHHFRDDFSSYHVVSYDTITGLPHAKNTAQGYSDNSAWARGQSWGLYGFTMIYRETRNPIFLEQARNIATFLMNHPRLPADKVPYWDYDAPGTENGNCLRDASAAAIMASALIELSQFDRTEMGPKWMELAEQQIRTLTSPAYLAEEGEQGGFILKHGVGNMPAKNEVDVPLTYADYYYVEALMRLKRLQSPALNGGGQGSGQASRP